MNNKEKNLIRLLEEVKRLLRDEYQNAEDLERIYELKKEVDRAFYDFLNFHIIHGKDENSKRKATQIYRKYGREGLSSILQSLSDIGHRLRKELGDDFRKMGYRILEQIRAGKRSDVEYSITRIFITKGKNVPQELIETFKPRYDDDTFKAFMYAFIGSVIKPEKAEKEG